MVSARDFVYASKKGYSGKVFVMGGKSVEYADAPKSSKIVRAVNGPGCQMVSPTEDPNVCEFVWLMDCDYKVRERRNIFDTELSQYSHRAGCHNLCWILPCPLHRLSSLSVSESWRRNSRRKESSRIFKDHDKLHNIKLNMK